MIFHIRPADGADAHHVMDIDIKCFDDPWPSELWADDMQVNVATYYGTPIAVVAFRVAATQDDERFVSLAKIAVKPSYRRRGVATLLMDTVEKYARDFKIPHVMTTVPESLCSGEGNIAGWLAKAKFTAMGIHEDAFESYGCYEDGFLFMLECK